MSIILHCDLNSFYASVECIKRPEISNLPIVVCGNPSLRHGIVLAKNDIAKKANIKTGDTIQIAKQKTKNLIPVHTDYDSYIYYSKKVYQIYLRYSDYVENFGIDECWLDITNIQGSDQGKSIALEIAQTIKKEIGLTVSIGISFNKIFAKLGSDLAPKNQIMQITQNNYKNIVWNLPVENLLFVGKSSKKILNKLNIHSIGQLANTPKKTLENYLGKNGLKLLYYAKGLDNSKVCHNKFEHTDKSLSSGITTPYNLVDFEQAKMIILNLCEDLCFRMRHKNYKCNKVGLKIKGTDLSNISFEKKLSTTTNSLHFIFEKVLNILKENWNWKEDIRALTVFANDLQYKDIQLDMFYNKNYEILENTVDNLNSKYNNCIFLAKKLEHSTLNDYLSNHNGLHKVAFINNVANIQ